MTIGKLLSYLNITAMVLGYIVLAFLISGVIWLVSTRLEAWRYMRRRQRQHDIEWDNIRSKWLVEKIIVPRVDTVEQYPVTPDRLDTDILSITPEHKRLDTDILDITPEHNRVDTDILNATLGQIYTYQKEQNPHEAS